MKITVLSPYVALIYLSVAEQTSAQSGSLPSTGQFMSILSTCAAGASVEFDANLLGSIESLYSGQATKGYADFRSETKFMNLLPDDLRLEGYRIYAECIKAIFNDPGSSKAKMQTEFIDGYTRDTPIEKVIEAFGQPYKIKKLFDGNGRLRAEGSPVSIYWFAGQKVDFFVYATEGGWNLASGVYVGWKRDSKRASYFSDANLPYLGMGISDKTYDTLKDFPLKEMTYLCPLTIPPDFHARFQYFTSQTCYFGAPGGYMNYEFVYQPIHDQIDSDKGCDGKTLEDMVSRLDCTYIAELPPVLGIVFTTEGVLPSNLADITMEWIYDFAQ